MGHTGGRRSVRETEGNVSDILKNLTHEYRRHKDLADRAMAPLGDDEYFRRPAEHVNPVAVIVKHLAGNLLSRWTDFLTSDGDKPWRNRDSEFVIGPEDTREHLIAAWEAGWAAVFQALAALQEADLLKRITIRGEEHTVLQAIHRSLTHTAYHVGQIVYLSHLMKTDGWQWITIPPGQSEQARARGGGYLRPSS